jgi:hypothetical protein
MVAANSAMLALADQADVDPALLEPPINILRIGLHPRGLGPLFVNLGDWHAHWTAQLERQLATTGDTRLAALLEEVAGYPVPEPEGTTEFDAGRMLGPVRVRTPNGGDSPSSACSRPSTRRSRSPLPSWRSSSSSRPIR